MGNNFVFIVLILSLTTPIVNAADSVIIQPTTCKDTENNCQLSNVQSQDGVSEDQKGHKSGVRFIETTHTNTQAVTSPNSITNVTVYVDRFESSNPGDQKITLQVKRSSDGNTQSCNLNPKITNNSMYDSCDVTNFIINSSDPENDVEGLTISYQVQKLGDSNYLYLDHAYVNITYIDSSPPTISLNSPSNDTWTNNSNVTFFFTPIDITSDIAGCSLMINNSLNQSNTTKITESHLNNITTSVNEGVHLWTVNCTDTSSNANKGTNITQNMIKVDLSTPSIQLDQPTNNTILRAENVTFNFTSWDNFSQTLNCSLYLDNKLNQSQSTQNFTAANFTVIKMKEGIHNWTVTCNDLAQNSFISGTRNFSVVIDDEAPRIENFTYLPLSTENLTENASINVTVNVTDDIGVDKVILQYKIANETFWNETIMSSNTSIYYGQFLPLAVNYTFRIYANDTSNNTNTSIAINITVFYAAKNNNSGQPTPGNQGGGTSSGNNGGGGSIISNINRNVTVEQIATNLVKVESAQFVTSNAINESMTELIQISAKDIDDMKLKGFPTNKVALLLEEARKNFESRNYDTIKNITSIIKFEKIAALNTNNIIQSIENKIKDYSKITGSFLGSRQSFSETRNLIELAKIAFQREDFNTSLKRAKNAQLTFDAELSKSKNLVEANSSLSYWWVIFSITIVLSLMLLYKYSLPQNNKKEE